MRAKTIMTWLSFCLCSMTFAQTANDIGKVVLGVRFVEGASAETMKNRQLLEDRLIGLATQAGYSSFGNNAFFISPNLVVSSIDVAEGGMKNVFVVRGDLYLTIQDDINGIVYSSVSYPFKGSATKKETAIKNAILNISYDKVASVFDEAKIKILSYYEQQKETIFARADTYVSNGDYDGAITCLMMIPEELADLHMEALNKAMLIYDQRDAAIRQQIMNERYENNNMLLTQANNLLSLHKPQDAIRVLWGYQSGNENQDREYAELTEKTELLVSAEEMAQLKKEERDYQDKKEREDRYWSEYKKNAAHNREMDKQKLNLKQQELETAERIAHHELESNEKTVDALKAVACEYIRANPNSLVVFR